MSTTKKPTILILHGWGLQDNVYKELIAMLEKEGFSVLAPNLPGFGSEPLIRNEMNLDDYVDFVRAFIRKKVRGPYVVLAHSFGGRIAILFAYERPKNLKGLIFTGAAGIRHPLSLRSKLASYAAKYGSFIFTIPPFSSVRGIFRFALYRFARESDYYKAGNLRETFKNIVAKDLTEYLPKITYPTLIVWGEEDTITPLVDGHTMKKLISGSKLIVIKNRGHKLPYESLESVKEFVEAAKPFLSKV